MIVPPIDFQARCARKIQKTATRPSAIAACSKSTIPSPHRELPSITPSDCLTQLEKVRSLASKTQDKIQLLWITSTHNTSPARSTLPSLNLKDKTDSTFKRLQRLIHNFTQILSSWLSTNLKGTFKLKLNILTTIMEQERNCLARFLEEWRELESCLQHALFVKFIWPEEVYDLLESVVRTIQELQDQVDEIHHRVYEFLEPQKNSRIRPMQPDFAALSASNGLKRHEALSGLRRRGSGLVKSSHEAPGPREGRSLLDERRTMR